MGKDRTKNNALSGNPIQILDMPPFVLPATLVYLIFQRYFVSGLTSGAVKG